MNRYLIDTNVISLLSPTQNNSSKQFIEWLSEMDQQDRIFLSVTSIHEIEKGISLLDHQGKKIKASQLKNWLIGLIEAYEDKIIDYDILAARKGGELEAKSLNLGVDSGMADAMIASMAYRNQLTLITLNSKHFKHYGIQILTPSEAVETHQH